MKTTIAPPTISAYTSKLLRALYTYEQAVGYYFEAVSSIRNFGDVAPSEEVGLTDEEYKAFDQGRKLIEGQIMTEIRDWANSTDPNIEI